MDTLNTKRHTYTHTLTPKNTQTYKYNYIHKHTHTPILTYTQERLYCTHIKTNKHTHEHTQRKDIYMYFVLKDSWKYSY